MRERLIFISSRILGIEWKLVNLVTSAQMTVEEKWIAAAMLLFTEHDKIVIASESCVGLAAILSKKCKHFCGKRFDQYSNLN